MCVKSHWNDSKFFSTRTLLLSHSETPNTRERRNPRHKRNKILHTIVVVVLDAVQLSRFTWDAKCSRFPVANRVLSFKHPPPLFYPSGAFKSTKMHIQSTPTVRPPLKWKRGGLLHNILNILKDLTKQPKTENETKKKCWTDHDELQFYNKLIILAHNEFKKSLTIFFCASSREQTLLWILIVY